MKKHFITGLVILLPLVITIVVVIYLVNFLTEPFIGIVSGTLSRFNIINHGFLFLTSDQLLRYGAKVVILILLFLFTVGLGIFLVRDVSRGIASIIQPRQALGRGDLTAVVPHQGEKTEIGAMADVLQVFKQALIDKRASDEAAAVEADAKIARGQRVDAITR